MLRDVYDTYVLNANMCKAYVEMLHYALVIMFRETFFSPLSYPYFDFSPVIFHD